MNRITPGSDADALNTILWLYRRLPRGYGRLPFIDAAVTALASRVGGLDVAECLAERGVATSSTDAQAAAKAHFGWVRPADHLPKDGAKVALIIEGDERSIVEAAWFAGLNQFTSPHGWLAPKDVCFWTPMPDEQSAGDTGEQADGGAHG